MTVFIIIFMCVSIVLALASIGYVTTDVVMEVKGIEYFRGEKKKKDGENAEEPASIDEAVIEEAVIAEDAVVAEPEIEPETEPVQEQLPIIEEITEISDGVDAEVADELISDELAMNIARYSEGAGHGKIAIVNIGVISENFNENDTVTLEAIKEKGLVPNNIGRLKVLAGGILTKPFTVKAESYSVQAIKMIELMGGTVIILKD